MQRFRHRALVGFLVPILIASLAGCATAKKQSWVEDYKYVDFDPFPGMNVQGRDVTLTQSDINGRVIWNLWSGDNAGFWNWLAKYGFGTGDMLKMIASPRNQRFETYGVFNQPGYMRPTQPNEYGLYIDVPSQPGSKFDIDKRLDIPTYGISSGVMGLRLFRNPKFDPAKWDADKYWNDPNYYKNPKLERPYRIGMACSFCHVGADPVNPPDNPNEPEDWGNFSDYVGQHYLKIYEVFAHELPASNFVKQILLTNPAGSLDTAFIATDYLNNPGTMNAVYNFPGRVSVAVPEKLVGGSTDLKNLEWVPGQPGMVLAPRVLKEGADSVGLHGALSRVYLNIGEYWEGWTQHFRPLTGIRKQSPIRVKDAQKLSPAWNWSEQAAPDLAQYLIKFAKPHKLADAPGGATYLRASQEDLNRGKRVFAQNCARCHSSKRPPAGVVPNSPEGRAWFEQEVMKSDFLDGNFLSSEERVPITEVGTNAARAAATNGLKDHIWDNFSSQTYKDLPAVGAIDVWDPISGTTSKWTVPSPGRGYYRPPSLVSLWSGAPFLHHNVVGKHVHGVSVEKRMEAFNDGIAKMLWPEKRSGAKGNKDGADGQSTSLWLTTEESWLSVPESYLHTRTLKRLLRKHMVIDPVTGEKSFAFGPIPKGTPVNLLANTNLELGGLRKAGDLAKLLIDSVKVMKDIKNQGLTGDAATQRWLDSPVVKELYKLNSCPDFIEDRGHTFGADLTDADKNALIAYLKTF
ncbi:MAG TPA: cytochrome c [Thermoanaerobaculia bacterium]|nr:cytochrome c [Thermoanaerobaculia bacterium]